MNPSFRVQTPVPTNVEIIPIGEDSPAAFTAPDRAPRRKATHLATLPGLTLGKADAERQHVNHKQLDRKPRSGVQALGEHTIHCSIGLERFTWDPYLYDEGTWATCQNYHKWRADVPNSPLSFDKFLSALLQGLNKLSKRAIVRDWIIPSGKGQWTISHSNPLKPATQEVVEWEGTPLLSDVVNSTVYNSKPSPGTSKVFSLWLCWTPELSQQTPNETKNPPRKSSPATPIKKEKIKRKPQSKVKLEPVSRKRRRFPSQEESIQKRPGVMTRERQKTLAKLLGPTEDADGLEAERNSDGDGFESCQS